MRNMMVLFTALLMLVLAGTAISEGAASVPEELVGIWHGTGTPKNGGPSIELTARIDADGSGEYIFIQDDYTESYPFTISSDDSAFTVDIPADNVLGIARCEGTWALEDGVLRLDITTTFASGGSYSYTAQCEKNEVDAAAPTQESTSSPSPTPLPEDLAALNAMHVQAMNGSGEAIQNAAIDGDVIVAYYTYSDEEAIPRILTATSRDEWDFPREYRAADYASARWAALIYPVYVNVGFYGQYGPANRTNTWLVLADLETGKLYREKIATEEPPRTIQVQTINGIPLRSGASGRYHSEEAFARLTELVEAAEKPGP